MLELRDGDVVVGAQPVLQAAQHLPLVFERPRIGDVNFQGEEADRHERHPHSLKLQTPKTESPLRARPLREDGHRRKITTGRTARPARRAAKSCAGCRRSAAAADWRRCEAAVFSILKHSRMSPTFTSLKFGHADAALESRADFVDVVLEALQRNDAPGVNHRRRRAARVRPRRA